VKSTVGYGGTVEIPEAFHSILDPFAVMAVAAAVTRTAAIGTNVLDVPGTHRRCRHDR
jgi:alkanesulfonate monooxygenase SsuD/methylene tetrahydromethanopterin reductase-like flavin-dependent oxidoreductase (luciferase family)